MNTTNSHLTSDVRLDRKKDLSQILSYHNSYNVDLTRERDLNRYKTGYSDKTNIYDQSRVVEPLKNFGTRFIRYINPTVKYYPAGMDGINSTKATGMAFTKPVQKSYPQNTTFILG